MTGFHIDRTSWVGVETEKKPGKKRPKKKRNEDEDEEDDDVTRDKIGRIRKKSQSHAGKKIGGWTEEQMNTALGQ